MAKLKLPKKLLQTLLVYIKEWLSTLLKVVVSKDQSGLYSSETLKILEKLNLKNPIIVVGCRHGGLKHEWHSWTKVYQKL